MGRSIQWMASIQHMHSEKKDLKEDSTENFEIQVKSEVISRINNPSFHGKMVSVKKRKSFMQLMMVTEQRRVLL